MGNRRPVDLPKAPRKFPVTVRRVDGSSETVRAGSFRKPKGYEAYLCSPHWRATRKRALSRDGYRCTVCKRTERLEVHHLTYVRLGHERLSDLATLCQRCHATVHQWAARERRARDT